MEPSKKNEISLVKCGECKFAGNSTLPGFSRCVYFPNWVNNSNSFSRRCDKYEVKSIALDMSKIYGGVKVTLTPKKIKGTSNILKNQFNPFKI